MPKRKRESIVDKQDIPALLKELEKWRVEHKMSKAKLARTLGLRSYVALYYWNKGASKPYTRNVWRIIRLLGKKITVEDYQAWTSEPSIRK